MQSTFLEEQMSEDERAFLLKKYNTEMAGFKKLIRLMMLIGLGIPIVFMIAREFRKPIPGVEKEFNYWIFVVLAMALFIALIIIIFWKTGLGKVWRDIEEGNKTVECTHVFQKLQDPHNGDYIFQLYSQQKKRIVVSTKDFNSYNPGDEINIEYAKHSKEFFSYF